MPERNVSGNNRKRSGRKLLNVLFILVVLPVVLLLVRSALVVWGQRRMVVEASGRYVRQLAQYAATRYEGGNESRTRDFLALLSDRGYERSLRGGGREPRPREDRETRPSHFIPGMLAYIRADGTLIAGSEGAEILAELFRLHPEQGEPVTDSTEVNGREMDYSLCVRPTGEPGVAAVAAVTLSTWIGGGGFFMGRFVFETMLVALFCLVVLFLLRRLLIRPLRALSDGLRAFRWGREVPEFAASGTLFGAQVEEVASLRGAIVELAREAVAKTELERRYVGDIVRAQEDERGRLAREIHDGPIQVVAALMQRIQMASLQGDLSEEERKELRRQLALAEEAAQHAVEDLRGICDSLVPPWVSLGLARCMEEMGARLARRHDVDVDVEVDPTVEPPQEATLALFRIFQEGVSNAVRHGRAEHIRLSVTREDGGILFALSDDGSGFDAASADTDGLYASGRRGLAGMKQRAESLAGGGTCTLTSAPGEGTTVEVRFGE